ncbi:MAG: polymer-forming cytoskeletal protein [Treponema sp.]|jgi:cytoskeletal protein CcmA (bactofilin family)|nr:polymer-forming cytoskeletal protein [Treponema sp.]
MFWYKRRGDFSLNTIIGPNTSVYGDIETGGFTRIDGNLRGNLRAGGGVVLGETARIRGWIRGSAVTIGGVVYGNVLASERVVVLATGLVLGDIVTRRIQAGEGCLIHGRIMVCSDEEVWRQRAGQYRDAAIPQSPLSGFPARQGVSPNAHG